MSHSSAGLNLYLFWRSFKIFEGQDLTRLLRLVNAQTRSFQFAWSVIIDSSWFLLCSVGTMDNGGVLRTSPLPKQCNGL